MDMSIVAHESLELISRAEIDIAIATAKSYPRDLKRFIEKSIMDATLTQETAEKCTYSLPRRDKNGKQIAIEGASVHLARICCANFQNIKIGARIIANNGKTITAQGFAVDLENNYTATIEVQRSIVDWRGNTYSQEMQNVTANAACAIAYRNVAFQIIPSAYVAQILNSVVKVAKGNVKDLASRRTNCLKWFAQQGVSERQVCDLAGVINMEEIGLDELFVLTNIRESLKSGESTLQSLNIFEDQPTPEKENIAKQAAEAYGNTEENTLGDSGSDQSGK